MPLCAGEAACGHNRHPYFHSLTLYCTHSFQRIAIKTLNKTSHHTDTALVKACTAIRSILSDFAA